MPRAHHVLIVADDLNVGRWLQHRVESLAAGHLAELDDHAAFERRLAATSASGIDVVLARSILRRRGHLGLRLVRAEIDPTCHRW